MRRRSTPAASSPSSSTPAAERGADVIVRLDARLLPHHVVRVYAVGKLHEALIGQALEFVDGVLRTVAPQVARVEFHRGVFVCSALGQETLVMEAIQAGAKDFIVKPFKPDAVVATLAKVLEKES